MSCQHVSSLRWCRYSRLTTWAVKKKIESGVVLPEIVFTRYALVVVDGNTLTVATWTSSRYRENLSVTLINAL